MPACGSDLMVFGIRSSASESARMRVCVFLNWYLIRWPISREATLNIFFSLKIPSEHELRISLQTLCLTLY